MRLSGSVAVVALCFLVAACDGDSPPGDDDGGISSEDAGGGSDACTGEADGTSCGSSLICIADECVESTCGDGYVDADAGEECDDGNEMAFDGCEPSICTFTCDENSDCDDMAPCNGTETCTDNVCVAGTPPDDGTVCVLVGGGDGVCRARDCVDPGCGNGVVDGMEQCDDGNEIGGDGCEVDCTFSCETNADCDDGSVCTGDETCDLTTHVCVEGMPLDCSDGDDCTSDECDSIMGCFNPLIDMDGDGHASEDLGPCGDDCDDTRADVFTGAEELCDGVDNNCNTDIDETAPTWYIDCDDDGYAESIDASRTGCEEPPSSATGCGGGWTTVRPVDMGSTDCNDANDDVFPGQTTYFTDDIPGETGNYDYNCDGSETRQYSCASPSRRCSSSGRGCSGSGFHCTYSCGSDPSPGELCFLIDYPRCGETEDYQSCLNLSTGCFGITRTRTQGCR